MWTQEFAAALCRLDPDIGSEDAIRIATLRESLSKNLPASRAAEVFLDEVRSLSALLGIPAPAPTSSSKVVVRIALAVLLGGFLFLASRESNLRVAGLASSTHWVQAVAADVSHGYKRFSAHAKMMKRKL